VRRLAKQWIDAIKVRAINGDAKVIELSGGNQQKVGDRQVPGAEAEIDYFR
jgi:ABC-type sugar transport system ATPase subunit